MNKDLISREAAIEAIRQHGILDGSEDYDGVSFVYAAAHSGIIDVIKGLPSAEKTLPPAQQWIPVTERLPEEYKTVIASVDMGIYPEARLVDGIWWWALEAFADYWEEINKDVTAWMPLPEPYREDKKCLSDK